jgi:hypothetical protein
MGHEWGLVSFPSLEFGEDEHPKKPASFFWCEQKGASVFNHKPYWGLIHALMGR